MSIWIKSNYQNNDKFNTKNNVIYKKQSDKNKQPQVLTYKAERINSYGQNAYGRYKSINNMAINRQHFGNNKQYQKNIINKKLTEKKQHQYIEKNYEIKQCEDILYSIYNLKQLRQIQNIKSKIQCIGNSKIKEYSKSFLQAKVKQIKTNFFQHYFITMENKYMKQIQLLPQNANFHPIAQKIYKFLKTYSSSKGKSQIKQVKYMINDLLIKQNNKKSYSVYTSQLMQLQSMIINYKKEITEFINNILNQINTYKDQIKKIEQKNNNLSYLSAQEISQSKKMKKYINQLISKLQKQASQHKDQIFKIKQQNQSIQQVIKSSYDQLSKKLFFKKSMTSIQLSNKQKLKSIIQYYTDRTQNLSYSNTLTKAKKQSLDDVVTKYQQKLKQLQLINKNQSSLLEKSKLKQKELIQEKQIQKKKNKQTILQIEKKDRQNTKFSQFVKQLQIQNQNLNKKIEEFKKILFETQQQNKKKAQNLTIKLKQLQQQNNNIKLQNARLSKKKTLNQQQHLKLLQKQKANKLISLQKDNQLKRYKSNLQALILERDNQDNVLRKQIKDLKQKIQINKNMFQKKITDLQIKYKSLLQEKQKLTKQIKLTQNSQIKRKNQIESMNKINQLKINKELIKVQQQSKIKFQKIIKQKERIQKELIHLKSFQNQKSGQKQKQRQRQVQVLKLNQVKLNKKINQLQKQINLKKQENQNLINQLQQLKQKQVKQIIKPNNNFNLQFRQRRVIQNKDLLKEVQMITHQNQDLKKKIQNLMDKLKVQKQKQRQRQRQIQQERDFDNEQRKSVTNDQVQIMSLSFMNNNNQEQIKYQMQLTKLAQDKLKLQQQLFQVNKQLNYYKQKIRNLQEIVKKQEKQLKISTRYIDVTQSVERIIKQKHKLERQLLQKQTKNQQIKKSQTQQQQIIKLKETLQFKQKLLQKAKIQKQSNQEQLNKLNTILNQIKIDSILTKYDQSITRLFVNSQIVPQQDIQNKQFIFKAFKQTYKKQIFKTQLIYKFDPLNLINFHQYIDGKQNVLLLASTYRGSIVGGFMEGPIAPQSFGGFGFIFNVKNQEVYTFNRKNNFKATSYDPYYLIYGNNELRVKTSDKQQIVFSNFGIVNSYFDARKKNVKSFLGDPLPGETERQARFITFEMYSLKFRVNEYQSKK